MSDERKTIRRVLEAVPMQVLADAPDDFNKAGILPFLPAAAMENWRFLLMQPVAQHPHLGPPKFQLAKGTRMERIAGVWQDIRGPVTGEPEPLIETALREGIEELGLDVTRTAKLFDCGEAKFTSVKTKEKKSMRLFAAQMQGADCLLAESEVAATTGARLWLDWASIRTHARPDHVAAMEALLPLLHAHITY